MRSKNKKLLSEIEKYILDYADNNGISPTMQEVADGLGISKTTAYRYITQLCEDGLIEYSGNRSMVSTKMKTHTIRVPVLGAVSCGIPKYAVENIEEYIRLPVALFGEGEFFILRASGDSMINAGINDGDLVLIKRQDYADKGQIVVALVGDEATLKRFFPEPKKRRIRLHPENENLKDIYVKDCVIQGVADKVLKDLY